MRSLIAVAALCGLVLTIAGAVGAHIVGGSDPSWNSAIQFGFVHTLAAALAGALPLGGRLKLAAGWAFIAGVVLFALVLVARALARSMAGGGQDPLGALGMLAPVGGTSFMLGWVLLAVAALRSPGTGNLG